MLTFDTSPGYTDTHPLAPRHRDAMEIPRIDRVGDAQVGQWSPEVKVNVGG